MANMKLKTCDVHEMNISEMRIQNGGTYKARTATDLIAAVKLFYNWFRGLF